MLIIGDKEMQSEQVAVRARKAGDLGAMSLADFTARALEDIRTFAKD
jgi:threonyl-tRNA synthetase